MIRRALEMLASGEDDPARRALRSPAVGIYRAAPRIGEGLVPGSVGGTLIVLGRTVDLLVPRGVAGTVMRTLAAQGEVPVAYGEMLLELALVDPAHATDARGVETSSFGTSGGASGSSDGSIAPEPAIGPDVFALRAPTTGVFYGRPDPASPPFVSVGEPLREGQTAGLIEVMKSFSPIVHPGGDLPSPGIVAEIRASEGAEVRRGQILFLLRAS